MVYEIMLNDLRVWKPELKILVKVSKRWETVDSDGHKCLKFVLIDEEGTKALASVGYRFCAYFNRVMQEGMWFEITDFVPRRDRGEVGNFALVKSGLTIVLNRDTIVRTIEPIEVTEIIRSVEFEDVYCGRCDRTHPIDLVGAIKEVSRPKTCIENEVVKPSVRFIIRNYNDITLECIIFGDLAESFCRQWSSTSQENVVGVFTDWQVMCRGDDILIRNVAGMSRFLFDPDINEVGNFRYIDSLNEKIKKAGAV